MAHAAFVAARGAGHAIDGVAASNLVRGHAAAGELAAALEVLEYVPPAGLDVRSLEQLVAAALDAKPRRSSPSRAARSPLPARLAGSRARRSRCSRRSSDR